jgi:hypothetical protein
VKLLIAAVRESDLGYLSEVDLSTNVRFAPPEAAVRWTLPHFLRRGLGHGGLGVNL